MGTGREVWVQGGRYGSREEGMGKGGRYGYREGGMGTGREVWEQGGMYGYRDRGYYYFCICNIIIFRIPKAINTS